MARGRKQTEEKLTVVPPTKKQTADILFQLRQNRFLEHAALLAGVSLRILERWIELGRQNVPGFVEFTDAIDLADAELGDRCMNGINQAIEDGDTSTLKWLYDRRLGAKEKHAQEKWLRARDKAYDKAAETDDVLPLEDAEKLLEESLLASEDGGLN